MSNLRFILLVVFFCSFSALSGQIENPIFKKLSKNGPELKVHSSEKDHILEMKKSFLEKRNQMQKKVDNKLVQSRGTNKQTLDSVYSTYYSKVKESFVPEMTKKFEYDQYGNPTHSIFYYWDIDSNVWHGNQNEFYLYNSQNQIVEMFEFKWNKNSKIWYKFYHAVYTLNSEGNIQSYIDTIWNTPDPTKFIAFIHSYLYDIQGNEILYEYDIWNKSLMKYEKKLKNHSMYDMQGNKIKSEEFYWQTNILDWIPGSQTLYFYDQNNNKISDQFSTWSNNLSKYIPSYRIFNEYNTNSQLISSILENWSILDSSFFNSDKMELKYTSTGTLIEQYQYYWDFTNMNWIGEEYNKVHYDNFDNAQKITLHYWENNLSTWFIKAFFNLTYDNEYSKVDLILPNYYFGDSLKFNHKLLSEFFYKFDNNQNDSLLVGTTSFFWSDLPTTTNNVIADHQLKLIPNPSSTTCIFEGEGIQAGHVIQLYDAKGQLILNTQLLENNQLDVSSLQAGCYFYTLNTEQRILRGKLMKQ